MRHAKKRFKLGRTASHRRCLVANLLKSLLEHGRIETTTQKAKVLKSHADKMVTLAKKNTLAARRKALAELMIRFNPLTPKERKAAKEGDFSSWNTDRKAFYKLFHEMGDRYQERQGGYTRVVRMGIRKGDGAEKSLIEFV